MAIAASVWLLLMYVADGGSRVEQGQAFDVLEFSSEARCQSAGDQIASWMRERELGHMRTRPKGWSDYEITGDTLNMACIEVEK